MDEVHVQSLFSRQTSVLEASHTRVHYSHLI